MRKLDEGRWSDNGPSQNGMKMINWTKKNKLNWLSGKSAVTYITSPVGEIMSYEFSNIWSAFPHTPNYFFRFYSFSDLLIFWFEDNSVSFGIQYYLSSLKYYINKYFIATDE